MVNIYWLLNCIGFNPPAHTRIIPYQTLVDTNCVEYFVIDLNNNLLYDIVIDHFYNIFYVLVPNKDFYIIKDLNNLIYVKDHNNNLLYVKDRNDKLLYVNPPINMSSGTLEQESQNVISNNGNMQVQAPSKVSNKAISSNALENKGSSSVNLKKPSDMKSDNVEINADKGISSTINIILLGMEGRNAYISDKENPYEILYNCESSRDGKRKVITGQTQTTRNKKKQVKTGKTQTTRNKKKQVKKDKHK